MTHKRVTPQGMAMGANAARMATLGHARLAGWAIAGPCRW